MLTPHDFFDVSATTHAALFDDTTYVWEAIARIKPYVRGLLTTTHQPNSDKISLHPSTVIEGDVYIGTNVTIAPGVYIQGPSVIEDNVEIRQGAFIRGNVLLASGSLIGHATEVKQTVLLENASAPHFSYLGESILGRNSNLGAGTKLSNLPVNSVKDAQTGKRPTIKLNIGGETYDTELTKFGAILGDDAQTGCNCVTNPGCLIGARSLVYPLTSLSKGYYPSDSIIKLRQTLEIVERR